MTIIDHEIENYLEQAYFHRDFDRAWELSHRLPDPIKQIDNICTIATRSRNLSYVETALTRVNGLYPEIYHELDQRFSDFDWMVNQLKELSPFNNIDVKNWGMWLEFYYELTDSERASSLQVLIESTYSDDHQWDIAIIQQITQQLEIHIIEHLTHQQPLFRQAVQTLITYFLKDENFPQTQSLYQELYEMFYLAISEWEHNTDNTVLWIRLSEARLSNIDRLQDVRNDFEIWFSHPTKDKLDVFLQALDLQAQFNVQSVELNQAFRSWAEFITQGVINLSLTDWQIWLSYAKWVHSTPDLIQAFQGKIDQLSATEDDVFAHLESGYRIGIFTLDPISAERAKEVIQQRNNMIDVRICTDKKMSGEARAIAENSDMVVVVTSCITHALTYGIAPYVDAPVYPQSRGVSSIIRAIEDRFRL